MSPALNIRLLGGLSVMHRDQAVTAIHSPRLHSLLAYLLLHRDVPQLRQHLAFTFWPDSSESQARNNLRQILHELRHALPEAERFLVADTRTAGWRADAPFELDVAAFEAAVAQAAAAEGEEAERFALHRAAELYRGDLLPACYDAWIEGERQRLRQLHRRALARLAELLERGRDYGAAAAHLQRLLQEEPTDEESCRALMRVLALSGDRAGALRLYRDHAATLRRELGVEPGPALRQAHEALLRESEATPAAGERASDVALPLVGRTREWQTLLEAFRSAGAGRPGFALITGEPGIGKSRLAEELLAWGQRQGVTVAATRSYASEGQLSLAPVSEWLRTPAVRSALARLDPMWLTEVSRILPELRSGRSDLPQPAPMTEYGHRQRFFEALVRSILAAPGPLILLVDDLQWCDRETIEWLHYLLRFDHGARMLAVGTARDEEVPPDHPLRGLLLHLRGGRIPLTEIALEPLDAAETARLAGQIERHELDQNAALRLFHETEGNPLFVVETARAGLGPRTAGERGTQPGKPELPSKVQAVIESRLSQLSPPAREVARLAAAIGRGFGLDLLLEAGQAKEDAVVQALDELWQRRIVREIGTNHYDFTHDKLREVAYADIGPPQRRFLHRRIAQALEKLHAGALDPLSGSIAAHYERAGLDTQAIEHYQRAAAVAQRTYATEHAIELFRRALTLLERQPHDLGRDARELRIQLSLARLYRMSHGWTSPEVERSLDRAVALCDVVGDDLQRAQAFYGVQSLYVVQARLEKVQLVSDELHQLYDRIQASPPPLESEMMLLGSRLHLGRVSQAAEGFERALERNDPSQVQRIAEEQGWNFAVHGRAWWAHALWLLGRVDTALAHGLEAMRIADELGQPFNQSIAATYLALLQQLRGDPATARAYAEKALALTTESRAPYYRAWSEILVRHAEAWDAPGPETLAAMRASIETFRASGARLRLPYYLGLLAAVSGRAGRVTDGLAALEEALAEVRSSNERWWDPELHRLRGELRLAAGATEDEVGAAYVRSLEIARGMGARALELRTAMSLARLRRNPGRLPELIQGFDEGTDTPDLRAARTLLAELTLR
ncbi:MAG TPA: BTAD domain-containing putative transcriptional regulator [Myxococcaceae bacterium]|nr:BTAD domain-containing putative transcriptional regulator [Myxococcaceae bacterium]